MGTTAEPLVGAATDERRVRRRDLVVVGWSHAGQHAYTAGLGIAIPFVVVAFHTDYAVVGALLAVCTIVGSSLQSLALVVRRLSARTLLLGQNVGSALGAVVSALSPGIGLFMLGRFVQASTGWPQHPVGSSYLSNRHPSRRGTILSWHVSAGNVGMLGAPLVVGAVIEAGGWRWGFWLLTAVLASTAAVVALGLPAPWLRFRAGAPAEAVPAAPAPPGPAPAQPAPMGAAAGAPAPPFARQVAALLRQRPVLALLVSGVVAAGGQGIGILSVYVPAYLHGALHLRSFEIGVLLTVMYLGAVIGPVCMGTLADYLDHRLVLLANYVLGALSLGVFVFVGGAVGALALVALAMGIFSYSELSLRQTLFADFLPAALARAGFGVFFTVSQAVGAVWVAIIGLLITDAGFDAAFLTMALTLFAAGAIVFVGTAGARPASRPPITPEGGA